MKKLLILTLACAYGITIHAMESGEGQVVKRVHTSSKLQREIEQLSATIEQQKSEYFKAYQKAQDAYMQGHDSKNPNWQQAQTEYNDYLEQTNNIHQALRELEQQIQAKKYELFKNHIKHSHPTKLKEALPHAIGRCKETSFRPYCLFTFEQKLDFVAYAQTIKTERNACVYISKGEEVFNKKSPDPKLLERYEKAAKVVLLMKKFKEMTFRQQETFDSYLTYQNE